MAAATLGRNPELFINGIVKVPVVAVLATALPDREPIKPLATTATFAAPPGLFRKIRRAKEITKAVAPVTSKRVPNRTNRNT
jgi:hypothetical protein